MLLKKTTLQYSITSEKTYKLLEKGFYTFKVDFKASKKDIAAAVTGMFGVKPLSVRTINVKASTRNFRGKVGIVSGYKKAMVKMPDGFKIEG